MIPTRLALLARQFVLAIAIAATPLPSLAAAEITEVIYPQPESAGDTRDADLVALIRLAMEATVEDFGPFTMRPSASPMSEGRYRFELRSGVNVNVIWSTVTAELEREFLPVRIPVRKGILGYRIFLIDADDRERFAAVDTLDALKALRVGQGQDWKDVEVFKANGFDVVTGADYEGLFRMLMAGRFDFFSRGINEAPAELAARAGQYPDMALEQTILLYYPWPKYFFVSRANAELAERIETGLERLIASGAYDQWFDTYHLESIEAANLKARTLLKLNNPLLPETAPLERSELWYDPLVD